MFDSETSTRSFPGNSCPVNYQKIYEKHPSSINLIKSVLFREVFAIIWKLLRTAWYQKCLCWSVSIKGAHYLNKRFCNIDLNNFLLIFYVQEAWAFIIGFIFWNNIFRHLQILWKILKKMKTAYSSRSLSPNKQKAKHPPTGQNGHH